MLDLIYDNDVTIANRSHTLEVYANDELNEAVVVLVPSVRETPEACTEAWDLAKSVLNTVVPDARARLLLCDLGERRYRWVEQEHLDELSPPWRDAHADEVRDHGLMWA
ncbi:hypothetical protein [Deinococcus yavapaiensis]|uniref:Uncharacterized protein n=1 Tax=Deinococcus yavapaiensis KR-236 TaxID=694435 RepID=A0A318SE06_9DEIO|nr:hypothetical protein [Deinococcus yavapaiensis]PYE55291.1 hypothetical protein DES52_103122 [Deinococcus yavapaiensis KR-236]